MLSDREYAEFKRGSLQMLTLHLLSEKDMYGYQISQEIKRRSEGKFYVAGSALYVVLYRMIEKGYISKREETGVRKPKVFYHLEPPGEKYLQDLLEGYRTMTEGVAMILGDSGKGNSPPR